MVGEVTPDMEYMSAEDKGRGRQAKQRVDERTGKRQWKVVVTDPSAEKERDASVTVTILADVQPVPPQAVQVMPGVKVRPVAFEGLTVEPPVMGGRYKYQGFTIRATGSCRRRWALLRSVRRSPRASRRRLEVVRPSREAVARWNLAYAEQTEALFAASGSDGRLPVLRLADGYAAVAWAWRVLAADLGVPLWARHACAVAAEEFDRRARIERARVNPDEDGT